MATLSSYTYELFPLGWFRFSSSGEIFSANSAFVSLLKYPSLEVLMHTNAWDLFYDHLLIDKLRQFPKDESNIDSIATELKNYVGNSIRVNIRFYGGNDKSLKIPFIECVVSDLDSFEEKEVSPIIPSTGLQNILLKNVREGVVVYDHELRYKIWNPYMEELTGILSNEVLGKTIQEVQIWDDVELDQLLHRASQGETIYKDNVAFNTSHPEKNTRYDVEYIPLESDHEGKIDVILFVRGAHNNQDQVEQSSIHVEAYKQRMRAEALGRMMLSIGILQELPSLLDLICREVSAFLNMDSVYICLLQEDHLIGMASHGVLKDKLSSVYVPLSDSDDICVKAIQEGKLQVFNKSDNEKEMLYEQSQIHFQAQSIIAIPLLSTGTAIGVLTLIDSQQIRTFTGDDLEFILQLGSQASVAIENSRFIARLEKANEDIAHAYDATLTGWAKALELRDRETEGHTQRVAKLTLELARKFDFTEEELTQIYRGALLHDIGKMGIPDRILLKPDALDQAEMEIMERHPVYAYEMLKPVEYLQRALDIPYCHHEKWDGTGYPRGLVGEEIPLTARIFAVVDVWDALTSTRPYRGAWGYEAAIDYIHVEAGKHFDPQVVNKFLEIVNLQKRK